MKKILLLLASFLICSPLFGTKLTFINDCNVQLLFVDESNGQAIRISPKELNTIDTTPRGFFKSLPYKVTLFKETVKVYVETTPRSNHFSLRFSLKQRFTTDNEQKNTFKYSDIVRETERATERFWITDYKVKKKPHQKKGKKGAKAELKKIEKSEAKK